jgi:hypothetical protein
MDLDSERGERLKASADERLVALRDDGVGLADLYDGDSHAGSPTGDLIEYSFDNLDPPDERRDAKHVFRFDDEYP